MKSRIKIVMERNKIMADDYPEIKKLIERRDEETIKQIENYFSGEDLENENCATDFKNNAKIFEFSIF